MKKVFYRVILYNLMCHYYICLGSIVYEVQGSIPRFAGREIYELNYVILKHYYEVFVIICELEAVSNQ